MYKLDLEKNLNIEHIKDYLASELTFELILTNNKKEQINNNRKFLDDKLSQNEDMYGVTTGFGDSARNRLTADLAQKLQVNLSTFHGCGIGEYLSEEICALVLLLRIHCLAQAKSGMSLDCLFALENLAKNGIFPAIPSLGSVGASGDLTPLSYIVGVLQGKRKVYYQNKIYNTSEIFLALNINPYKIKEKEALAIMNGTTVMSAIMVKAWLDIDNIADISSVLTALLVELLEARTLPFNAEYHELKPHQGQIKAAQNIRKYLSSNNRILRRHKHPHKEEYTFRLQDNYSLRCSPHIIGVLYDTLSWTKNMIETEINAVTDNPLFLHDKNLMFSGGHFFGGHIAIAADTLKISTANVLNLIDRQMALLVDSKQNDHLFSDNLIDLASLKTEKYINHGVKALQIAMSAITAESLKLSQPMSIFSRATECNNQDVVSMGTIAARECFRLVDLARYIISIWLITLRQAIYLKQKQENWEIQDNLQKLILEISNLIEPIIHDRELDSDIERIAKICLNFDLRL